MWVGTRFSMGRKGTATAWACSQTSSGGPGQFQGRVLVSSSTPLKPALCRTTDNLPGSAKRKGSGPPGCNNAPPTFCCTTPIMLCQYGCSNVPQARKHARPSVRRTRRNSRNAPTASLKNMTPKREVATSKLLSGKGRLCASPCCVVRFSSPRAWARPFAISNRSALRSSAVTCPVDPTRVARLIAGSPVPLAKSSTSMPGFGCAYSTSASVTAWPMAADFAFHFSEATRRYWLPQPPWGSAGESGRDVITQDPCFGATDPLCLFLFSCGWNSGSLPLLGNRFQFRRFETFCCLPQTLEIIKFRGLFREHGPHEIDVVEQDPLCLAVAFDVGRRHARRLKAHFDLVGDGLHLARITSTAQHEVIGKGS